MSQSTEDISSQGQQILTGNPILDFAGGRYIDKRTRDLLLRRGEAFGGGLLLPKSWQKIRGPREACFENASRAAFSYPEELCYVEGYAIPASISIPLPHAWLVDAQGQVVDPTWDTADDYLGVRFSVEELSEILLLTGHYGVLSSLWYNDFLQGFIGSSS